MKSYKSLKTQIAKLEKQAALLLRTEAAGVVSKIKGLMVQYGLTLADLGGASVSVKKRGRKPGVKAAKKTVGEARFRDPASGKTWTGRGKPPTWIAGIADRTPFLIDAAAAAAPAKPAVKKRGPAKKAAAQPTARKVAAKKATRGTAKTPASKTARKSGATSPAAPSN